MSDLGLRVNQLRTARGWSLQELADKTGFTKSHIWEIEACRSKNPTLKLIIALTDAFGVALDELIGRSTSKPRMPGHLAEAINAVRDVYERGYQAGLKAGRAALANDKGD